MPQGPENPRPSSATVPAKDAFIRQLAASGVEYVFGNPGTTEQGFIEAISRADAPTYILALHEAVAVGMADGYARAAGKPGVVQLHASPGIGNAMGMLYDAYIGRTPLVVYVGQQDRALEEHRPMLSGRPAEMATSVLKKSIEVRYAADLPVLLRRALRLCIDQPQGPVCLAIPSDVLDEEIEEDLRPVDRIRSASAPHPAVARQAAEMIQSATRPIIVCGDGVAAADAHGELLDLAERIGCAVYTVLPSGFIASPAHPLYLGNINVLGHKALRAALEDVDLVVVVGTTLFPFLSRPSGAIFAEGTRILQVDCDAEELGRTHFADLAIKGDAKHTLAAIDKALSEHAEPEWHEQASSRAAATSRSKQDDREADERRRAAAWDNNPMSPSRFAWELVNALSSDCIVFDDSTTISGLIQRYLPREKPGSFFVSRGAGLGQGLPATLGVKLANPDRPVLGVIADGTAMYTIQALWTAARYGIAAVIVICNNGRYRILQHNMREYLGREAEGSWDEYFSLTAPSIDFVQMAQAYGVAAMRVTDPSELASAIQAAFNSGQPYVIDAVIQTG